MRPLLLASLLIAACASRPAPSSTPSAPAPAPAPAPPSAPAAAATPAPSPDILGITELEFYVYDVLMMQMGRDGLVSLRRYENGAPGPMVPTFTVARDGTITSVDGGRGELTAEGRVRTPRGDVSRFRLEGETITLGGRQLHLDEGGILRIDGTPIEGTPPRVAGVVDRASRRTALMLLGMMIDAGLR